jgi:hypothetical protein
MLNLVVLCCALLSASYGAPTDCPAFGEWMPQSEQCLWFPLKNMRQGVADACQTTFNVSNPTAQLTTLGADFPVPNKCGHCSFKLKCRKRDRKDGCYSLDLQKETCHEFGDVCTVEKHPKLGCRWNLLMGALKNCANKPDIPDWRRDAIMKYANGLPETNCVEKGDQCKCCCHPYVPSEDGTQCVEEPQTQTCAPFGEPNAWSQCLWYPLDNVVKGVTEHCGLQEFLPPGELPKNLLNKPEGLQIPEQCGYCSFRTRCRKRDRVPGCFALDVDKKACGPDDCPTCGNVCTLPKVNGESCDWARTLTGKLLGKAQAITGSMPYWRRRGVNNLMRHLPYGQCKEVGGQCKCCCHPYEPNEDGTACVPTNMCAIQAIH